MMERDDGWKRKVCKRDLRLGRGRHAWPGQRLVQSMHLCPQGEKRKKRVSYKREVCVSSVGLGSSLQCRGGLLPLHKENVKLQC